MLIFSAEPAIEPAGLLIGLTGITGFTVGVSEGFCLGGWVGLFAPGVGAGVGVDIGALPLDPDPPGLLELTATQSAKRVIGVVTDGVWGKVTLVAALFRIELQPSNVKSERVGLLGALKLPAAMKLPAATALPPVELKVTAYLVGVGVTEEDEPEELDVPTELVAVTVKV